MFIVDFDDTLFNTQNFKENRKKAIVALGVSEEEYLSSYQKGYVKETGEHCYSNESHAEALSEIGYDYDIVLQALKQTTTKKELQNNLFDDTKFFLDFLKKRQEELILLSLGSHDFQELKTSGTEIVNYFDQIYFVQKNKHEVILDILNKAKKNNYQKNIWFINDKLKESKDIEEKFKELKVIIKNKNHFKNFTEIKDYIENYE